MRFLVYCFFLGGARRGGGVLTLCIGEIEIVAVESDSHWSKREWADRMLWETL